MGCVESRSGVGNEATGRNVTGDGEADRVVSGSGDPGIKCRQCSAGTRGAGWVPSLVGIEVWGWVDGCSLLSDRRHRSQIRPRQP